MNLSVFVSSLGHSEGEHGSGKDPRRECHQTEEPVSELPEDERSGRCSGSESPNCSYNEPGTLNTGSLHTAVDRKRLLQAEDWHFRLKKACLLSLYVHFNNGVLFHRSQNLWLEW